MPRDGFDPAQLREDAAEARSLAQETGLLSRLAFAAEELARLKESNLVVPEGWQPYGQDGIAHFGRNRCVYHAGSEGYRVRCLCYGAVKHLRAIAEGKCTRGLNILHWPDWRKAIAAVETGEEVYYKDDTALLADTQVAEIKGGEEASDV